MKNKYILLAFLVLSVSFGGRADPRIRQVSPAVYADVELPFRCVLAGADKQISSTIVLTPDDFSFIPLQNGDVLPRYAVNGYTFQNRQVNEALAELVKEAGITVAAPQTEYPVLDAKNVKGELSSVVAQLAEAGDVFYNYKASTKTLTLLRRAEFALTVPQYRPVLMALLDALRGSGIENLSVDWEKYQIKMLVSTEELQKAQGLVRQILDDSYMLVADIEAYQAVPYPNGGEWQQVLNQSTNLLASIGRATIGRSVILKSRTNVDSFLKKVRQSYQMTPLVSGQAVVPNGWQMKFNVNECSNNTLPYPDMSVVLKTRIKDQTNEHTKITLYTGLGELTTFNVSSALNQEIALVGIPSQIGNTELLFTLRFKLVRFIQKGE